MKTIFIDFIGIIKTCPRMIELQTIIIVKQHNSYSLRINLYLQVKRRDCVFLFGFPLLQGNLEVTVKPVTVGHLRRWNVLRAFFHSVLDEIGQHDDYLALLLPDHPPKVGNGRLYWRLARDIILCGVFRSLKHRYTFLIRILHSILSIQVSSDTFYLEINIATRFSTMSGNEKVNSLIYELVQLCVN